jgi:hypothetical protein
MKYKALILSLLLLLPLGALSSLVRADFPYIPPYHPPTFPPVLWVDMNNTGTKLQSPPLWDSMNYTSVMKVYGPCVMLTTFPVDVRLWNIFSYTNSDVFAFDFNLTWDADGSPYPYDPHLTLMNVAPHLPTGWVTVVPPTVSKFTNASGNFYTLEYAATDVAPNGGLTDAENQSLATLTFRIDNEPLYTGPTSDYFFSWFNVTNNGMSGDGSVPLPLYPEVDDGQYWIYPGEPDVHLTAKDIQGPKNFTGIGNNLYYVTEKTIGFVHTIQVYFSNVTHAFGFSVQVDYSDVYKYTDIQHIRIGKDWVLTNYAFEDIVVTPTYLIVTLARPLPPTADKPLICSKWTEVFEFDLTSNSTDVRDMNIPASANTTIDVSSAYLLELQDYAGTYSAGSIIGYYVGPGPWGPVPPGITPIWLPYFVYSCPIVNWFNPKTTDLLEDDAVTDIKDLDAIIAEFGMPVGWHLLYDTAPYNGANVDIFDIVTVAKKMNDP